MGYDPEQYEYEWYDRKPATIKAQMVRDGWTVTRAKPRSGVYLATKGTLKVRGWDIWELAVAASKAEGNP